MALGSSFSLAGHVRKRTWRNVVEYECDPILGSLVSHAVLFLVVNLVSLPDFQLVRSAIDREPDFWIGRNRHVYSMRNRTEAAVRARQLGLI